MKIILLENYEIAPGRIKPPGTVLDMTEQAGRMLILTGVAEDQKKEKTTLKKKGNGNNKRS